MSARARSRPITRPAGLRRIRRLKLLTALLLMAALSVGMVLFGVVVAAADAGYERDRVETLLRRQVVAGRDAVSRRGGLDAMLTGGYPQLYVVDVDVDSTAGAHVMARPHTPFWPAVEPSVVAAALDAVDGSGAPWTTVASAVRIPPSGRAEQLRILSWPVAGPRSDVVVVGVANVASGETSHARLVDLMWWSGAVVLLVGVALAVVAAQGRFWLVDRALERHEQFLHDTAHELRAPVARLRAIVGGGLAGDEPPRAALERAMRVIVGADEVIHDLMTLTRIETGRAPLDAERIRLDLLVEVLASQRADDPPVSLWTRATVVSANSELVRRAVGNLIDNAVRHGRIEDTSAEVVVEVGDGRVTVSDRGPGVAPQLLPLVMERITTGRRRTGSGLGLAIAGWVARIHGGQLTATNRDGRGAEFTLHLPE